MDLVIDIQCLKDVDNNKTPKEIALVSLNGDFHCHWLVAPTACVDDLSDEIGRQNNWLSQHCHDSTNDKANYCRNIAEKYFMEYSSNISTMFLARFKIYF